MAICRYLFKNEKENKRMKKKKRMKIIRMEKLTTDIWGKVCRCSLAWIRFTCREESLNDGLCELKIVVVKIFVKVCENRRQ